MEQSSFFVFFLTDWNIIQLEYHKDELAFSLCFLKHFFAFCGALEFFVIYFPILANVYKG